MKEHLTGDAAAAAALAHLLADHPELSAVIWSVGEMPGVLTGRQINVTGRGEIVDACAKAMGGHVARTSHYRENDGHGVAQLVTVYDEVPVQVWASYPLPDSTITAAELRRVLTGRRFGVVADIEGGDEK